MSVYNSSGIIIGDSKAMLKIVASFNDESRGIIDERNMFVVQATGMDCRFSIDWSREY